MKKHAVLLVNLGGPDSLQSVEPFLFRLFNDPYILRLPRIPRWFLAKYISRKRRAEASAIYKAIGGKSPILEATEKQSAALEHAMSANNTPGVRETETVYKTFVAMQFWKPFVSETVREIRAWNPDLLSVLPLFPQFSESTTLSSVDMVRKAWKKTPIPVSFIYCYPTLDGLIEAQTQLILEHAPKKETRFKLIFSAHGLPQRQVDRGDPYVEQIRKTVEALEKKLETSRPSFRFKFQFKSVLSFQSRVGPLPWTQPYTEDVLRQSRDEDILLVPVSFVSEHSETLYELDQTYRAIAEQNGARSWTRIPTVQTHPDFIDGLRRLVLQGHINNENKRICSSKVNCLCARELEKSAL